MLALARSQGGVWPAWGAGLLSVGALHELLFASAFAIVGPSPYLPRLVTAIQAALTVPLVYVLTRELCRPLGRRRIEEAFVMPQLARAGRGRGCSPPRRPTWSSPATSPAPRASFPVLVIGLLFAVERALNGADGRWLLLAGALLGLALQTSPLVLAIVPGLPLAVWWRGRSLLLSRWFWWRCSGSPGCAQGR